MRISLLINGMTGYLDAQYRALHAAGHELQLVTPGSAEVSVGAMVDTAFTVLDRAGEYAEVQAWSEQPEPAALVRDVLAFAPDAVLMTAWNFSPAYRAVMKAVPSDTVRILYMDNLWRAAPRQWLGRLTHRWYVDPVADLALVPSDRTEFYARRLGFGPRDIIRGGVVGDTATFGAPPRAADSFPATGRFLYVGRLVDHKGADVLAASYRRYREVATAAGVEPWALDVVGIGPLAPTLEGIAGVTMHGFLPPADVARLMREASCFVLTSHIEPFGVAVHEAAASSLPILCTDFSGAGPVFVQDGYNGWLVASGDTEAWAEAMQRMATASPDALARMSEVSNGLARRASPEGWAANLVEAVERRRAAGGR